MKIEDIKRRLNELIDFADSALSKKTKGHGGEYIPTEDFNTFRSASLSFLSNAFGISHTFYKEFDLKVKDSYEYHTREGRGILTAARQEVEGGWIFKLKSLVSAEIFTDFLEMSEYLLKEGYKDPAAVMIGSVLEEHLRQLCRSNGLSVEVEKDNKFIPKKADTLNSELYASGLYNLLDQKAITSWLELRNKAAHGKYSEYSKEQVAFMYQAVVNFISRTS